MSRRILLATLSVLVVLTVVVTDGNAQSPKRKSRSARDEMYRTLPVDDMIRQAAENVSRRYNLNGDQAQFTQDMMAARVYKFLDEHEDEIWPIIRDMSRYQNPNKRLPPKAAKRMGKALKPLFLEARAAILEANSEWREILSPEQKRLHDHDLNEMQHSFKELDDRFTNWSEGKVTDEQGIFPSEREDRPPVDPKMPALKQSSADRAREMNVEWWDGYVGGFIEDYELDDGQVTTARSILKELKQRAEAQKAARKADYERVQQKLDEATRAKDLDKLHAAEAEKAELNAFLPVLFKELKKRLDTIPRTAQREKFKAKQKNFKWDHRPIGTPVEPPKTDEKAAKDTKGAKDTKDDTGSTSADKESKDKK